MWQSTVKGGGECIILFLTYFDFTYNIIINYLQDIKSRIIKLET